jgi:hypothetical protein
VTDEKRKDDDEKAESKDEVVAKSPAEGPSDADAPGDASASGHASPEEEEATQAEAGDAASESDGDEGEEPEEAAEEDLARPEAIARRVAALGEEDPLEAKAREEERKLAERRAAARKGKKKKGGGLEVAASKKLTKIGERAQPRREVAVAADADPLIDRTVKLGDWAKKNQTQVQILGALIAAALLGVAGFLYIDHKRETDASVLLGKAVADERARIGDTKDDDEAAGLAFKTYEARRDSALGKYREVQSKYPKTGAAILSRLAEGSLLLDKRDADGAIAAFGEVKQSPLAAADLEVKCRALEGLGFAHEVKAQLAPAEAPKNQEEALKVYKELENTDVRGFKELAMYHQGRILQDRGDKDKAKEILLSLKQRLEKPDDPLMSGVPMGPAFPYLRAVAFDRLREIDPTAVPKGPTPGKAGAGGAGGMSPEDIQRLIEQMKKQQGGGAP